jgi:phenylacetate-CoA ligase
VPLRIAKSDHVQTVWCALTLREALWHRRDLRLKLGVLRRDPQNRSFAPAGRAHADWSTPFSTVFPTGPATLLDSRSTTEEYAAWLLREEPAYLIVFPTMARDIARHLLDRGLRLPSLRGINTRGEPVDPELRELCRSAFGVPIADMYSANEVGYVALQCPQVEHYHVQSESALVEVVGERGEACRPGETGNVVVTPLHNYAMPMLRYALGDLAEVGPPCACGRGLPVLKRILGRTRDTLALPSGTRRYARIDMKALEEIPGIVQFQVVQKTLYDLEMKLVTRRALGPEEEERLRAQLKKSLGEHLSVVLTYHDEIKRAPSGKYFDFMSEVPT